MTPLAHHIVKELTLPLKRRTFRDDGKLLSHMSDIHCFEISQVASLVEFFGTKIAGGEAVDPHTSFLPAPRTWIEGDFIGTGRSCRIGWLLEEVKKDAGVVRVFFAYEPGPNNPFGSEDFGVLHLGNNQQPNYDDRFGARRGSSDGTPVTATALLAALALINTPRIINRQQHMPHRGLERKLVAARGLVGKFPLHAWTEIKLSINAPKDMRNDPSIEAHYTGQRALHFCRAHLRVRMGRLEIVRSHWRGDASLGIKQSRYRLEMGI